MKYMYLPLLLVFIAGSISVNAQHTSFTGNGNEDLLALNTGKAANLAKPTDFVSHNSLMPGRSSAGEGVPYVSFYQSLAFGMVTPTSKYAGLSATGTGLMYNIEIGAKIPLFHTDYSQYIVSGALFYQGFSAKGVFADTFGTKRNFNVTCIGAPLTFTAIKLNKRGGVLGYYYELGVNIGGVYKVSERDKEFNKQFSSIMIQPTAGLGLCFAYDGGERFTNRTMLLGLFVANAVTNMAKTDGVTMHAMFYGIRYTGILN